MKLPSERGKGLGNLPYALILAIVIQLASGIWWVSAKDRDAFFLQERVEKLETGFGRASDSQAQILERLARIEERVNAQLDSLDRIEKRVSVLSH